MNNKVLGLDFKSNSIGWALMNEKNGTVHQIIDLGSRTFNKAVEEKTPTPKNQKRRNMRIKRRVLQRRSRRKQKMINYLVSLDLLPQALSNNFEQEELLNKLGDPYELRTKGLDEKLTAHQFGRILLHFVARRGFLSNKKHLAGDLIDDPDTQMYLSTLDNKEINEGRFKASIAEVYQAIKNNNARTLGEYLFNLDTDKVKRNRAHNGGNLRTDRAMYKNELEQLWKIQQPYFDLPDAFMSEIERIIFYQRPLKLKKDRIKKCLLEPKYYCANTARLEVQKFNYLQNINNLEYFEQQSKQWFKLNTKQKDKLKIYFEHHSKMTLSVLKSELDLKKITKINLETKIFKGNVTACKIRDIINNRWDEYSDTEQCQLFEDLFTIKKKSSLKTRLITHWGFDERDAIELSLCEFDSSHSNHSLKVIKKLLPFLQNGLCYDEAYIKAGYNNKIIKNEKHEKLSVPPEISNLIVSKGLHELRRVINAIIMQYGKPDIVRIKMTHNLEINTKRYKKNELLYKKNQKTHEEAINVFREKTGKNYPSYDEKIRYRLWKDQHKCCAYSGDLITLEKIFSTECVIDHILPFKKSFDDSYMNKVLCLKQEKRNKNDKTPIDTWGSDSKKWNKIMQTVGCWNASLKLKINRFYINNKELEDTDFISSQLDDTRYIACLTQNYVRELGCEVSVIKNFIVDQIRHQWGFNSLIGEIDKKKRTDHRHNAIDAVIIASTSRSLYQQASEKIQYNKLEIPQPYDNILQELNKKLKRIIVSHTPQRKLSGALHKETGVGYIAKYAGLVYRKTLDSEFSVKNVKSIVDEKIRDVVLEHIYNYKDIKEAFNVQNLQTLKLGKNSIKRVRVFQSKIKTTKKQTPEDILQQTKFGVKDKSGKIFKYMSYGNNHHIEVIQNIKTGQIKGEFITMMEAHRRAMTGTRSAKKRNIPYEQIVKTNHDNWSFLMVLYINDIISIKKNNGKKVFYRIQKLDSRNKKIFLRLNTTSTLLNKDEELHIAINKENFDKYKIRLHKINVIGKLVNEK